MSSRPGLSMCLAPALAAFGAVAQDEPPPKSDDAPVWTLEELRTVADEIRADIEEIRGKEFKEPVDVKLADGATFVRYAKERFEATSSPAELQAEEMAAKLLGMLPGDLDLWKTTLDVLEEQVGGFYDPTANTFYLMDSFTGGVARLIMAHELAHALDDQYHDLDGTDESLKANSDARLAYHAVVEGSGMALMSLWFKSNIQQVRFDELLELQSSMAATAIKDAPPFIWKPFMAVYTRGESFLGRTSVLGALAGSARMKDIEQAFNDPPRSTEQILHPEKYWKEDRRDEPVSIACDASELGDDWNVLRDDTLGELTMGILTQPFAERTGLDTSALGVLGLEYTNEAAEGWGGDRVVLLGRDGEFALRLVTRWDTSSDADQFLAAMRELRPGILAAMGRIPGYDEARIGFRVESGEDESEVRVSSWIGASDEEAAQALDALSFGLRSE